MSRSNSGGPKPASGLPGGAPTAAKEPEGAHPSAAGAGLGPAVRRAERRFRRYRRVDPRAAEPDAADLVLRDRVARYPSPRWFLNQFNCAVSRGACSEDADYLVSLALDARDGVEAASYLYEAETALLAINRYIPLGAPIRWSLVRADIEAFSENPWNIHPLFPLSRAPI